MNPPPSVVTQLEEAQAGGISFTALSKVIRDVDVAGTVDGNPKGMAEAAAQRRHAAGGSTARGHLFHRAVAHIGDIDVAGTVDGNAQRDRKSPPSGAIVGLLGNWICGPWPVP